ncbi:MAG TPA: hypothetical protein VEA59_03785 [Patescibacteria group bacterium]|nr:hypothetical protein [Patescibacteria group bacterium]
MFISNWVVNVFVVLGLIAFGIYVIVQIIRIFARGEKPPVSGKYPVLLTDRDDAIAQFFGVMGPVFFGLLLFATSKQWDLNWDGWYIFLFTSLLTLVFAYWQKLFFAFFAGYVGVLAWFMYRVGLLVDGNTLDISITAFLGFVLSMLTYILGRCFAAVPQFKRFGSLFTFFGMLIVVLLIFYFSSHEGLSLLTSEYNRTESIWSNMSVLLLSILSLLALAAAFATAVKLKAITVFGILGNALLTVFYGLFVFIPQMKQTMSSYGGYMFEGYGYDRGYDTLASGQLLFLNIVLLTFIIGMIYNGYLEKTIWKINVGTGLLVIFILAKYFDFFQTYLQGGVFFIGMGLILFLLGYVLERGRKMLIKKVETSNAPAETK